MVNTDLYSLNILHGIYSEQALYTLRGWASVDGRAGYGSIVVSCEAKGCGRKLGICYRCFFARCRFSFEKNGLTYNIYTVVSQAAPRTRGVCHSFKSTGSCSYGPKCKFSHDTNETQAKSVNLKRKQPESDGDSEANANEVEGGKPSVTKGPFRALKPKVC